MSIVARVMKMPRELKLFVATSMVMGIAFSMYDSTFNNFINEKFVLSGFQRALLEIPRELPGLLVVFVSPRFGFYAAAGWGHLPSSLGRSGHCWSGSHQQPTQR